YQLRVKGRDPAALWFGLFSSLYGARVLAWTQTVPLMIHASPTFWSYLPAVITYIIPLPGAAFIYELFPSLRPMRWLIGVQAAFAIIGIVTDQVTGKPESFGVVNSLMTLAYLIAFVVSLFRTRESAARAKTLRIGLLAFCFTVLLANLAGIRLLS